MTGRTTCPVVGGPHGEPIAVEQPADTFEAPQVANMRAVITALQEERSALLHRVLAPVDAWKRAEKPEKSRKLARLTERLSEIGAFFRNLVDNPLFHEPTEEQEREMLAPTPPVEQPQKLPRVPKGTEAYLASLYEVPLLTRGQEAHLFRKMNFLRYRGCQRFAELDLLHPDPKDVEVVCKLYAEAVIVRNQIVRANLRLVVSFAKWHITEKETFFELISDANMSLLRAANRFDFARGNKFSTYASWAIQKNFSRTIPQERKHDARYPTNRLAWEMKNAEHRDDAEPAIRLREDRKRKAFVGGVLDRLDEREREVIVGRFGLNGREPQTLKQVGEALGVTKERIRQIEVRVLAKLRRAVEKGGRNPDDLGYEGVQLEPEDFDDGSSPDKNHDIPLIPPNPHPLPARRRRGMAEKKAE